jgi:hypothetical protein
MFSGIIIEKNKQIEFSGKMTAAVINEMVRNIQYSFPVLYENKELEKRVTSSVIEIINNIIFHSADCEGKIEIINNTKHFTIISSNNVSATNTVRFKKHLKNIKAADKEKIKELKYNALLETNGLKKNAGIGLFEIWQYGVETNFSFKKINNQLTLFSLESTIKK